MPPTQDGNPQCYIIWHAEEACKQGKDAAVTAFLEKMNELLDKKAAHLSRTNLSSMFHRCAKVVNATIQASTGCLSLSSTAPAVCSMQTIPELTALCISEAACAM